MRHPRECLAVKKSLVSLFRKISHEGYTEVWEFKLVLKPLRIDENLFLGRVRFSPLAGRIHIRKSVVY